MARTIPAPPYVAPEPTKAAVGDPIMGGSAAEPGHWLDIAKGVNLAISDGHAGSVIQQNWIDVGAGHAGAGWIELYRYRVPELSPYHTVVQCEVYGLSATGTGRVRFSSVNAFGAQWVALGVADAWHTTANLAVSFGWVGYEEIYVEHDADVEIRAISVTYLPSDPSGLWPGADGALAAGATGSYIPMDDLEVGFDSAHPSRLGHMLRDNLALMKARQRVYMNWSADATGAAAMSQYSHRQLAPVFHRANVEGEELTVYVRVGNASATTDGWIYIQHGGAGAGRLHPDNPDAATPGEPVADNVVAAINVPKSTAVGTWLTTTVSLQPHVTGAEFGPGYAAMMQLGVRAWGCECETVSMWGP